MFVPPPADTIEDELKRVFEYANAETDPFEHPVVKAALLHFWLAYLVKTREGRAFIFRPARDLREKLGA